MISDLETIKISQLTQASASQSTDRFPIAQGAQTKSIEPGLLSTDWRPLGVTPTVVSSAGQKENVIRFSSVDYSGTIPVGGKLLISRTGTTPTTSMQFVAACLQYASKASPTGITFTNTTFSVEGIVKFDSYTQGHILSRRNGAAGWDLEINSVGQIALYYSDGTNTTATQTLASVEIGKTFHVAATVNIATKAVIIYFDGVAMSTSQTPSTGTSLVQGTTLYIGSYNGSSFTPDLTASNIRLWSTARTATEIRDNMGKENPDSTTGLLGHWKGNGSWNDSSANANHLTASNGAINNAVGHAFSANEYAIATKVQFTGGNTDVTIFTGSGYLPKETLGATSYSTARVPFGFPADRGKWTLSVIYNVDLSVGGPVQSVWYTQSSTGITVPVGGWLLSYNGTHDVIRTGGTTGLAFAGLSKTVNTVSIKKFMRCHYHSSNVGSIRQMTVLSATDSEVATVMTPYYLVIMDDTASVSSIGFVGNFSPTVLRAECTYL